MATKKMARFWKNQWASKAWVEEMNSWANAQEETSLLKQFLTDYAEQQYKGNAPFLRKKVKEFVAQVHAVRVETAKHKGKQVEEPAVEKSEVEEVKPIPSELVKFESVAVDPGGTDWEVLTAELYEQVQELNDAAKAAVERIDQKVAEQEKLIATLQEQVKGLVLVVNSASKEGREQVQELGKKIDSKVSKFGSGVVYEEGLKDALAKAVAEWALAVREAIGEVLEGKNQRTALEWWDRVVVWLNERPKKQEEQ